MTWYACTSGQRRQTAPLLYRYSPRLLYHPRSWTISLGLGALIARKIRLPAISPAIHFGAELMAMASVPEGDRCGTVVNFGKRDCAFDAGAAAADAHYRNGGENHRPFARSRSSALHHGSDARPRQAAMQVGDIFCSAPPVFPTLIRKTLLPSTTNVPGRARHAVLTGIRAAALAPYPGAA